MGLAADLSYTYRPPNAAQRGVQVLVATRAGAWVLSKTLARLDGFVGGLTGERLVLPQVLAGLPVLVVATTGRRSGQPRATRLIAVPVGDTLALLGTNFGQRRTPAWVFNLEADPHARVTHRGITHDVVVRPATEPERAEVLKRSAGIYGGYLKYQQRIEGLRKLRVFVLDPETPATTTRVSRHIRASRSAVYRALLDPDAVQQWMVPDGMTSEVHTFEPREGGSFRISLTYDAGGTGKTSEHTDTHHGRFTRLVRDTEVVQVVEFETDDPALQGEMTIRYTLAEAADGGTDLVGVHGGLPPGVPADQNELGWRRSLDKLAQLVEDPAKPPVRR